MNCAAAPSYTQTAPVIPLVHDLDAVDRQCWVDRGGFSDDPGEPRGPGAVLRHRPVRANIAVESAVVQHVVGMPFRGQLQLRTDRHIVGAAGLMLDGVDVGNDPVVDRLLSARAFGA